MSVLSEDDFIECFKPLPNTLNSDRGYDFGDGCCLYETYGEDLDFVKSQPMNKVWTIVEGDETQAILPGFHVVNRLGYLVCDKAFEDNYNVTVIIDTNPDNDFGP